MPNYKQSIWKQLKNIKKACVLYAFLNQQKFSRQQVFDHKYKYFSHKYMYKYLE